MFILQCSTFASALDSFTSRHCLIALLPFVRFILSTSLCLRIVFDICIHVSRYHCQMFPNGCTVVFHCIRHTSIFDSFRVPFLLSSHLSPFFRTSAWHFRIHVRWSLFTNRIKSIAKSLNIQHFSILYQGTHQLP